MGKAKDIVLRPVTAGEANELVKRVHYSGKVVQNSQLHIGVFLGGRLEGAMQFGPSLDKRKIQGLVSGTQWHEFIELNRMAFSDALPRNSESRAIAVAFKLLRKHAPQLKWVVSFADATQCGDGTIYRASGFVLTSIRPNGNSWILEDGTVLHKNSIEQHSFAGQRGKFERIAPEFIQVTNGKQSAKAYLRAKNINFEVMDGFQLRYIYFLDPSYRARLTVPELPYSAISEAGAGMYKGVKRAGEATGVADGYQPEKGQFDSDPPAFDR